jgi:hypothetical protein
MTGCFDPPVALEVGEYAIGELEVRRTGRTG